MYIHTYLAESNPPHPSSSIVLVFWNTGMASIRSWFVGWSLHRYRVSVAFPVQAEAKRKSRRTISCSVLLLLLWIHPF